MKTKQKRLLRRLTGAITGVFALGMLQATGMAANTTDCISAVQAGAAAVLEADASSTISENTVPAEAYEAAGDKEETKENSDEDHSEESSLVIADVENEVNVRKTASEDAEKVGKLYNGCGGEVLERSNGWTKLKSGNVVGWAKDEYLLFGEEAKKKAKDAGNLVAKIEADTLRVREAPEENADVCGLIAKHEEIKAIEMVNSEWVSVSFGGDVAYVAADYVDVDFQIAKGETIEEIEKRKKAEEEAKAKEAAEKAKLTENRGAVAVDVSEDVLLAALIQCEAGSEPYEGQLAVGAVVMNRVRNGGGSISNVIYAPGQFPPATNGTVAKKLSQGVKASCLQAAQEAIAGASNVGGATRFRRAGSREGIVIGNHVFW